MACFAPRPAVHPFLRFPAQELAPFFRILDDVASDFEVAAPKRRRQHTPIFHPRFDVQEGQQSFHVQGEVPGVEQKDIEIEFTDANTLVIKGRRTVESSSEKATTAAVEDVKGKGKAIEDNTSTQSESETPRAPSPYQPTVEDDDEFVDVSGTDSAKTPATETTAPVQEVVKAQPETAPTKTADQSPKYILRERSVGEFQRSFTFPGRVDQEAVTASLKNGILSIVVPKAEIPRRTITVQ